MLEASAHPVVLQPLGRGRRGDRLGRRRPGRGSNRGPAPMIDITAHHIYDHAHPDAINSWLRTLASIRALAATQLGQRPLA